VRTDFALHAPRLFDGENLSHDVSVLVSGGKVVEIVSGTAPGAVSLKNGTLLAPGFVDCQVNGGGGVLLNDAPSPQTVAAIAHAHLKFGTTSFLPTLISDTREKMRAAINAVDAAIAQEQASVLGIHLEGPFLNPSRKGVHSEAHIIEPQMSDIGLLSSLENGVTLVTLAPEKAPPGFIRALKQRGVIISAGHTDASAEQIELSLKEGVTGFTHLYNAMSQMSSRAPGSVGAALADDASYAGIIADGRHVSVDALRVAFKAKTAKRLFLVSDAMASLGTCLKTFQLFGETIHVEQGRLATEKGTLAGAQLDMASAVRFMVQHAGVKIEEALMMATSTPANFLGLEKRIGRIAPNYRADLVALDANLQVADVWLVGEKQA
jgi:N-acetylglucosamine-6-phosphate deacetylase